jgi:hypothetical protein
MGKVRFSFVHKQVVHIFTTELKELMITKFFDLTQSRDQLLPGPDAREDFLYPELVTFQWRCLLHRNEANQSVCPWTRASMDQTTRLTDLQLLVGLQRAPLTSNCGNSQIVK